MFTQKNQPAHRHTLKRAYQAIENDKGIRYILFWVCITKPCPYKEAYDLVDQLPKKEKE